MPTKIEWTDETFNPVVGCTKKSPGCQHCYALKMAWRLMHNPNPKIRAAYAGVAEKRNGKVEWTGKVNLLRERLDQPLHWRKSRMIFLPSMGDLFHKNVSLDFIGLVLNTIHKTPWHTYQLLTKRPERMKKAIEYYCGRYGILPNLWLGISAENQETFDERWDVIRQLVSQVAVLFFSFEPLLGKIVLPDSFLHAARASGTKSWCIAGGETDHGARPMHPDWARSLRDQAQEAGVPFFFKSWGEWVQYDHEIHDSLLISWGHDTISDRVKFMQASGSCDPTYRESTTMIRVGKAPAGHLLDGREWREFPK